MWPETLLDWVSILEDRPIGDLPFLVQSLCSSARQLSRLGHIERPTVLLKFHPLARYEIHHSDSFSKPCRRLPQYMYTKHQQAEGGARQG